MCIQHVCMLTKIVFIFYVYAAIQMPKQIKVWHTAKYKDLVCGTDAFNNHATTVIRDRVHSVVGSLPCIESGSCRLEDLEISDCTDSDKRQRRQETPLGFYLLLSAQPDEGIKE